MSTAATVARGVACTRCQVHAESVFRIEGLDCGEEVAILERRLRPLAGVEDLTADIVGQRLHVKYDAAVLSAAAIVEAVGGTGMRAWLEHERPVAAPTSRARGALVAASGAALLAGFGGGFAGLPESWSIAAFVVAAVAGGVYPFRRAAASLRMRSLDIHVLMLVAVAGALALGEWAEAGTVVFLFSIAQWLESRTMERARESIRALMELAPVEALVRHGGHEHRVAVDTVVPGATIVVRPGEKIPLDGVVAAGRSEVNQAPITGESLPLEKGPGDEVFAGTINGHGALDVTVTRQVRDTTIARIIHMVEAAQAERAPAQQFVDRFARWYTPGVIVLAASAAVVGPLVTGDPLAVWIYRALVLLVVSCPCALVISTPVSIVAALAGAARRGVLIKGGAHLERLAGARTFAFDKTGTLTRGVLVVDEVVGLRGTAEADLIADAAAVEARSEHPIGAAIVALASARGLERSAASDVRAIPGLGAEGTVAGRAVVAGNARLFEARGLLDAAAAAVVARLAAEGRTAVLIARDGVTVGVLAVADAVRPVARDVMQMLQRDHGARVVMLTGDIEATARTVAETTGITEWRAQLLPADKVEAVKALRAGGGAVVMVGDGVNDAPALAAADVGMVMGAIGSDAALETADVALMSDELQKVPYALRLSRATLRNIKANIAISLGLKAAFLAMAVAGTATLWMAVLADTGASLIVVANALRLLRYD
ncbi:MAG: cation-translocating P-type ATPase [Vicinamibacterales bacterium]|nr:cation-translocating P-type ATPase [Vicinamibacterales bacterium]